MLTANGAEGVDVYEITNIGDLNLVYTLSPGKSPEVLDGFVGNVDIVDVNYEPISIVIWIANSKITYLGQMLIALDKNFGLIFFDFSRPETPERKYYSI